MLTVLAIGLTAVGPWAIAEPGALARNTILFPLGLTSVKSPATSPLPGHLLAGAGAPGYLVALIALGLAAAAIGVWLVLRPPATAAAAASAPRPDADVRSGPGDALGILRLPSRTLRLGLAGRRPGPQRTGPQASQRATPEPVRPRVGAGPALGSADD